MKIENWKLKINKGFTMIELLVVIAVIGVLAVAVLSAINPIEQINKGRDTGRRSDSGELIGAVERYYASIGWYPWEVAAAPTPAPVAFVSVGTAWLDSGASVQVMQKMVDTNEIKSGLKTRIDGQSANPYKFYFAGLTTAGVHVCFLPKSKSFQTEAWTRCNTAAEWDTTNEAALKDGACPVDGTCAATVTTGCYICLP